MSFNKLYLFKNPIALCLFSLYTFSCTLPDLDKHFKREQIKRFLYDILKKNTFIESIGELDPSFNGTGKVITNIGANDFGQAIALQPDGKILVAGYSGSVTSDFAIVRYNSDGSLDSSFGTNGIVTTPIGSGDDQAYAITLQADGKILVPGLAYNGSSLQDFAVVRYNPDGSLDTNFDSDGIVTTPIGASTDQASAIAIQSDGKILVAGYASIGGTNDFAIVRYNPEGSLDTNFDSDGIVFTDFGSGNDQAYAITLQPDGKILVAGYYLVSGGNYDFVIVRYNTDGSLDTNFDLDGKVFTNFGSGSNDYGQDIALQPDGKILVAGYSDIGGTNDFAIVRYNSDGSLDSSFGTNGIVTTPIGSGADDGFAITLQPNGKLIVAGWSYIGTSYDFAIVRYNTDGSLDTSFDSDGIVITDFGSIDQAYAITLQPDGKILVAGHSGSSPNSDFAIARYR